MFECLIEASNRPLLTDSRTTASLRSLWRRGVTTIYCVRLPTLATARRCSAVLPHVPDTDKRLSGPCAAGLSPTSADFKDSFTSDLLRVEVNTDAESTHMHGFFPHRGCNAWLRSRRRLGGNCSRFDG